MILIVTISDDLHAKVVQQQLFGMGMRDCHILECDRISETFHIGVTLGDDCNRGYLKISNNLTIATRCIELIWWRRMRADQKIVNGQFHPHELAIINNDSRGALTGVLETTFHGTWISSPAATDRASNKIYQLKAARDCGFRIPSTIVSQDIQEVTEFVDFHRGNVIVKPVVGAAGPIMFTQFIRDPTKYLPESFSISPAIYQEYIDGTEHIRLNCFGDNSYAAKIATNDLDWRPNLNVPISDWNVPVELHLMVRRTLDRLGLAMGIVDIKITPEGEFVWLEVNPQGQFLFLEPLTKVPLTRIFAEFLLESMKNTKPVIVD